MTREKFKELLKKVNPNLACYWPPTLDLPRAAWDTAAYCFLYKGISGEDANEIRRQLLTLSKDGFFDFEDERRNEDEKV